MHYSPNHREFQERKQIIAGKTFDKPRDLEKSTKTGKVIVAPESLVGLENITQYFKRNLQLLHEPCLFKKDLNHLFLEIGFCSLSYLFFYFFVIKNLHLIYL